VLVVMEWSFARWVGWLTAIHGVEGTIARVVRR
jgi:hypothetical protein